MSTYNAPQTPFEHNRLTCGSKENALPLRRNFPTPSPIAGTDGGDGRHDAKMKELTDGSDRQF